MTAAAVAKPRERMTLSEQGPRVRAHRYDAAQTTDHNKKHWDNASAASANAAASSFARAILRNRARYEIANNSYARGIMLTLANDTIGRGPRLQLLPSGRIKSRKTLNALEVLYHEWATEVRLAEKLRTMRMARGGDGETFAILRTNPRLRGPVKLDLELIEAECVTSPGLGTVGDDDDGIVYDTFGNPLRYNVSTADAETGLTASDRTVLADQMIHWFRPDRAGQRRGVCEIAPALELFAQLRRYTLAALGAAETAADMAMVIYSDLAGSEPEEVDPMDAVELEARLATTLPYGWKVGQIKAEQPTTTYGDFKREIVNEIARCLNMPFNVAAGNSAGYNYASGRLDHQTYFRALDVDRHHGEGVVLSRVLRAWFEEAQLVEGLLPQSLRNRDSQIPPPHRWFWDGREHVDPLKVANANRVEMATGATGLPALYAKQGLDHEVEIAANAEALGLSVEDYRTILVKSIHGAAAVEAEAPEPEEADGDE